jgi:hypothetical protein
VRSPDLRELLREFYADKLGLTRRHEAAARLVAGYDFNNTYQYIIAREQAQLEWLRRAVAETGGTVTDQVPVPPTPSAGKGAEGQTAILTDDARLMHEFVEKWRPRVEPVIDSRDKLMLGVILGETLEHKRFFDQAIAGRHDLLGRRTSPSEASGRVLPTRWVE